MNQNLNDLIRVVAKQLEDDGNPENIAQAVYDAGYRQVEPAQIPDVYDREDLIEWMTHAGWKRISVGEFGEMWEKDWRVAVPFGIDRDTYEWLNIIGRLQGVKF